MSVSDIVILFIMASLCIASLFLFRMSWKLGKLAILLGLTTMAGVTGLTYKTYEAADPTIYRLNTSGIVTQGTGIFIVSSDPTGLKEITSINWGQLSPGETKMIDIYLTNKGNAPIAFTISTSNWSPINGFESIEFIYTISTSPLGVGRFRKVPLSIHILPSIAGIVDFSFDILVVGTA